MTNLTRVWFALTLALGWAVTGAVASAAAAAHEDYRWDNVPIGGGGYVTGIIAHPRERDLIYIRTDVGGCYRWEPQEKRWIQLLDWVPLEEERFYGVDGLALAASDPNRVYIAAGKYGWGEPGDVLQSADRGRTWRRTNLNKHFGGNWPWRWAGERLAVDPANPEHVLCGTMWEGLWRTTNGGQSWQPVSGIPVATDRSVHGRGVRCVLFGPAPADGRSASVLFAGVKDAGVFQSTDGGVSWEGLTDSPRNPNRLALAADGALLVTDEAGVFLRRAGAGWANITPDKKAEEYAGLSTHPTDPGIVICARRYSGFGCPIFYSADAGTTWRKFTTADARLHGSVPWAPKSHFAASLAQILIDPHDPKRVWFTDWYATWVNPDFPARPDWFTYERGHEEIVAFTLRSPARGAFLLAGVADVDGFRYEQFTQFPQAQYGGSRYQDTVSLDVAARNPDFAVRVGGRRGGGSFSQDNGRTWTEFATKPGAGGRIAVSPDASRIVWAPTRLEPFVSTNCGQSWVKSTGAPKNPVGGLWDWRQSLCADGVDPRTFYFYTGAEVFCSTDGGLTFEAGAKLERGDLFSIKTPPGIAREVWVATGGGGLWRSTNSAAAFHRLPGVTRARLFAFGKSPPGRTHPAVFLYGAVHGNSGIFRSDDFGENWQRINPDHVRIGDQPNSMEGDQQVFGRVYIGTNGRGIFYGEPNESGRNAF